MSRASRLLDLMQLLRRHRAPVAGSRLAAELGVSMRTLYRDIATLQAQGAEIRGEPGVGYLLKPGFILPPLMFSEDELEALVLGSRWVERRGDERLAAAGTNAIAKIRSVLPASLRDSVDAATLAVPMPQVEAATVDVSEIRRAIRRERKLRLTYIDGGGAGTERTVWPFLIGFFERVLVVAAWCELRVGYRSFRVDRIAELVVQEEAFPRRRAELLREWQQAERTARN